MKKKILIAEDDQAIREIIKSILENEGYIVLLPQSEHAIHKAARDESPVLILLDIWLDGHDGGKIAKDLKEKQETKNIPIIMMSANNETEKITKAAGANDFLLKPFNIDDLLSLVRKHTE